MFSKAILELYVLRDKYKHDKDTVDLIDKVIFELCTGMSAVIDIITADNERNFNKHKN